MLSDKAPLPATAQYGFIPGLDGLRAISVLIVIIAHMGFKHIVPGGFGVTVFFFISGFLITRLLIAEHEAKARIKLKDFYIRRFVRLYPALLFMVFATTATYLLIGWGGPKLLEFLAAVFYGTNIYQVNVRIGGELPFMPWTHLWSLAVEEHFYLMFPLLLVLLRGNWVRVWWALICVIGGALLWRTVLYYLTDFNPVDYSYMMTDTRLDSIAWGCLLSVSLHLLGSAERLRRLIGAVPIVLSLGVILSSFVIRDDAFRYTLRFTLQGAALLVLFLNLYFYRPVRFAFPILEYRPLAWTGMVSYALYLWHVPLIDAAIRLGGDNWTSRIVAVAASFAMAAISFYYVEKPFMVLRKRFGAHIVKRGGTATLNTDAPIKAAPER
ncbi:acyltransferase family protein [Robiginitomaculum antarcticum]|uniref:acyltransferase family protein n=1 Tax=Robiginitomaculum antarcticum TaxID=437507 RepID=UPI0003759F96|nr:acyltransferase [Robiginitomaculum antarcticum]